MKPKVVLALVAVIISLALVAHVRADDDVETFVFASKTFGKGEKCFTTKRTGVIMRTLGTECESAKKSATRIDKEIENLPIRLGAKKDAFKGTTIVLTSHHIIYWRQGIYVLAHGVTSGKLKNQSIMRWGVDYGMEPYDLLVHELGHVAWNLAGINSSFLDSDKDSLEKRAILSRDMYKRMLPKDHPVTKKLSL